MTGIVVVTNTIVTANSVLAVAVEGSPTNNGSVGIVPKTTVGGLLDSSFITVNKIGTNVLLAADFTADAAAVYTNVCSYTTQLGTGATVYVTAQMAMKGNGDNQIGRLAAGGFIPVDNPSDAATTGNYDATQKPASYAMVLNLISNITINLQVKTTAGASATVYKHATSSGTGNPVISNATRLVIMELK